MFRKTLILPIFFMIAGLGSASPEEYFRIARPSYLDGHVSFQHAGDVDWSALSVNMPLQPGDRIYTGDDGRAEIEFDDGSVYRMAERTDIEILSMNEAAIQIKVLVGLSTLNVQSDLQFEIDTPPAAFATMERGVYRFDVAENGDTDGVVRKGSMEAVTNESRQRMDSGELRHIALSDPARQLLSRYQGRDAWDEWNDRRNADMMAYSNRGTIPSYVFGGVGDLDRYGRWVDVSGYGTAWVPLGVGSSWYPYWEGRWCYRPFLGWTWVSYEPWGWLPYHYGRWFWDAAFGWCWLPGPALGFNFWSPGLVRFYQGPGWVSWCPLGPGDYYNVNLLHYRPGHVHQLNEVRMLQTRSPGNLFNRGVPGAVRAVQTNFFLNEGLGNKSGAVPMSGNQLLGRGQLVNGMLDIKPTARSFSPMPDRPVVRPSVRPSQGTAVRTWERVLPSNPSGTGGRLPSTGSGNITRPGATGSRNIEPGTQPTVPQGVGRPIDGGSRQLATPASPPRNRDFHGNSGSRVPNPALPPRQSTPPTPAPRYERVVPERRPESAPAAPAPAVRPKNQKEPNNSAAPSNFRDYQDSATVAPGLRANASDSWQGRSYGIPAAPIPGPSYTPPPVGRVYTYAPPAYLRGGGSGFISGSIPGLGMGPAGPASSSSGPAALRRR